MTNEQIEKALICCQNWHTWEEYDCYNCPCRNVINCKEHLHEYAIDYINRLKVEKEQIRKKTAQEIYKKVDEFYNSSEYDHKDAYDCNTLVAYDSVKEFIKRKYGVEVNK